MSSTDEVPLFAARDPAAVAAEDAQLAAIAQRGPGGRLLGYLRLSGPGFLQSAFSLGGGSLVSSLFAGALLGYALLWVQPMAMACGVVFFMAMAYQTMHSGETLLQAVRRHAHPLLAWAWALSALIASLIWVLPQFAISIDVLGMMLGRDLGGPISLIPSGIILALVTAVAWNYGSGKGVRFFETVTRLLIALIVLCFLTVVAKIGLKHGFGDLLAGLFGFHVPTAGTTYPDWQPLASELAQRPDLVEQGVTAADLMAKVGGQGFNAMVAGFSAAVGINMTFLFPYSVRARGWGPRHKGLATVDLWAGMLVPFAITTGLLIIAAANHYYPLYEGSLTGKKPDATVFAGALAPALGPVTAHWIFGIGVLGMTLSSIVMMMLVSGFVVSELCGLRRGASGRPSGSTRAYRIGLLLPAVGILGPWLWGDLKSYLALPTSIICLIFLPIAYITVLILHNKRSYLGDAMPTGARRLLWNGAMGLALTIVLAAVIWTISTMI